MIYMKHKEHGNAQVADAEQAQREIDGWVRWPRTKDQKAGIFAAPAKAVTAKPIEPAESSKPATGRNSMLDEAERRGLKVDGRWSDARLAEELAKA